MTAEKKQDDAKSANVKDGGTHPQVKPKPEPKKSEVKKKPD